jgi:hypothetical protein
MYKRFNIEEDLKGTLVCKSLESDDYGNNEAYINILHSNKI